MFGKHKSQIPRHHLARGFDDKQHMYIESTLRSPFARREARGGHPRNADPLARIAEARLLRAARRIAPCAAQEHERVEHDHAEGRRTSGVGHGGANRFVAFAVSGWENIARLTHLLARAPETTNFPSRSWHPFASSRLPHEHPRADRSHVGRNRQRTCLNPRLINP